MSTTTRLGLVGCGVIGSLLDEQQPVGLYSLTHASAVTASERAELVAVCDIDIARARECARARNVPGVYDDLESMLKSEDLDGVIVASPTDQRLPMIRLLIEHKIELIWCEKPLSATLDEAYQILNIVPKSTVFIVNYMRRWTPLMSDLYDCLESKRIGHIQSVVIRYGKGIANNGSHAIDLLWGCFKAPISTEILHRLSDGREGVDHTIDALLKYADEDHQFLTYLIGSDYQNFSIFEIDFLGSKGRVRILDGGQIFEQYEVINDPIYPQYQILSLCERREGRINGAFDMALDNILDLYEGKSLSPIGNLDEAVAIMEIIETLK